MLTPAERAELSQLLLRYERRGLDPGPFRRFQELLQQAGAGANEERPFETPAELERRLGLGDRIAREVTRRAEYNERRRRGGRDGGILPPPPPPPIPPPPTGPFTYRRLIELATPTRSQRRIHVIRVDNITPLTGRDLEVNFNIAIANLRRQIRYSGALWYIDPAIFGRTLNGYSPPPNPLGNYEEDMFPPDDIDDSDAYVD